MGVKVPVVILLFAALIGAINGAAAGINMSGPTSVGAGGQNIAPCDTDVAVSYNVAADTIDSVTVSGIANPGCNSHTLVVVLTSTQPGIPTEFACGTLPVGISTTKTVTGLTTVPGYPSAFLFMPQVVHLSDIHITLVKPLIPVALNNSDCSFTVS